LLITQASELRTALKWLIVIGGGLAAVILFFENWGHRGLIIASLGDDSQTNPLALASVAAYVASAALFVELGSRRLLGWPVKFLVAAVCVFLILRSGSRGQMVALLVSVVLMLPVRFKLDNMRGILPLVISFAVIITAIDIGSSLYVPAEETRWTSNIAEGDAEGRLKMAGALLGNWSQSYLTIIFGLGNSASFDSKIIGYYPHIMPLEVLGEEGIIGFALLLVFSSLTIKHFYRAVKSVKLDPTNSDVVAVIGAFVVTSFLLSLKQGNLLGNNLFFMTSLLLIRICRSVVESPRRVPQGNKVATRVYLDNLIR